MRDRFRAAQRWWRIEAQRGAETWNEVTLSGDGAAGLSQWQGLVGGPWWQAAELQRMAGQLEGHGRSDIFESNVAAAARHGSETSSPPHPFSLLAFVGHAHVTSFIRLFPDGAYTVDIIVESVAPGQRVRTYLDVSVDDDDALASPREPAVLLDLAKLRAHWTGEGFARDNDGGCINDVDYVSWTGISPQDRGGVPPRALRLSDGHCIRTSQLRAMDRAGALYRHPILRQELADERDRQRVFLAHALANWGRAPTTGPPPFGQAQLDAWRREPRPQRSGTRGRE